jgi:hypothetical protein
MAVGIDCMSISTVLTQLTAPVDVKKAVMVRTFIRSAVRLESICPTPHGAAQVESVGGCRCRGSRASVRKEASIVPAPARHRQPRERPGLSAAAPAPFCFQSRIGVATQPAFRANPHATCAQ